MLNNPEFLRLARSKMRPAKLALMAAIGVFVCGGLLVLMYLAETDWGQHPMRNASGMFHTYFFWITGIQLGTISLLGLILSAQNVALERERSTLDFQRLVGMGPAQLALGKLFGGPAEAFFMALIGTVFAIASVVGGGVSASVYLQSQVCMFVFGILISAFGLLCSSVTEKTSNASGLAVLISIVYSIVALMFMGRGSASILSAASPLSFLVTLYEHSSPGMSFGARTSLTFDFFGMGIPILAGYCLVNLLLAWVCFVATERRLASDEFSYISLRHAVIAFALIELILIGGVYGGLGHGGLIAFHAVNGCLLVALAFGLSPNAELFRGRLYRAKRDEHWKVVLELSNKLQDASPIAALLLFALAYAVLGVLIAILKQRTELANFVVIAMNCGIGIAAASVLVYLHVYLEKNSFKAGVGLVVCALVFPPLMIAVVATAQHTVLVSPAVYIGALGELIEDPKNFMRYTEVGGVGALWSCPMICVALGLLSFILAAMRVRFLLDLHEQQRKHEVEAERKADAKLAPGTAAARLLATAAPAIPAPAVDEVKN